MSRNYCILLKGKNSYSSLERYDVHVDVFLFPLYGKLYIKVIYKMKMRNNVDKIYKGNVSHWAQD